MHFFTVDPHDPWRMRDRVYFDYDRFVTETTQDIEPTLERNRHDYNHWDGTARRKQWRKDMVHVARIPLVVLEDLVKQGILSRRGYKPIDEQRFDDWLDHPDNRVFRVIPGRIR